MTNNEQLGNTFNDEKTTFNENVYVRTVAKTVGNALYRVFN
jgi:hypothetical protein